MNIGWSFIGIIYNVFFLLVFFSLKLNIYPYGLKGGTEYLERCSLMLDLSRIDSVKNPFSTRYDLRVGAGASGGQMTLKGWYDVI